jgi:hypothetical protein
MNRIDVYVKQKRMKIIWVWTCGVRENKMVKNLAARLPACLASCWGRYACLLIN